MVDAKIEQWSTKGESLLMLSPGYATVQWRVYHILFVCLVSIILNDPGSGKLKAYIASLI